jgi:drug/metabolite transporter (DMT)-like permease
MTDWIAWTLLAASMQAVRTAGQKYLHESLSALTATLARYLFGLPVVLAYVLWLDPPFDQASMTVAYGLSIALAGGLQVLATVLLVRLFSLRNFALGSTFIRLEIMMTAVMGSLFFQDALSSLAWLGVMVASVGIVSLQWNPERRLHLTLDRSVFYGLASALAFSLTSLLIRDASLSLGLNDAVSAAAMTLALMVILQTGLCVGLVFINERREIKQLLLKWRLGLFIGVTGVLGSIGWFTAFTLERAAYVKTLGQIEFVFSLLISYFIFKERAKQHEWWGMGLVCLGAVLMIWAD